MADQDVVIIGAGVIGLVSALELKRRGRSVLLVDRQRPGSGASMGNAGTIADFAVAPIGSPALLKQLPEILLQQDGPFSIRSGALMSLMPWLGQFVWQSLGSNARKNMQAIAALTLDAGSRWQALATSINADHLLHSKGCIYVYESKASFLLAKQDLARRAALGVPMQWLSPADLAVLEPHWPQVEGGGVLFPAAQSVLDPGKLMQELTKAVVKEGVELMTAEVQEVSPQRGAVVLNLSSGKRLQAKQVVVAAGAHSKKFADQVGDAVPLDTERGYHLEYDGAEARVSRPVCSAADGFYCSPMLGRLRAAGTVELGGLAAPVSEARVASLSRRVAALFPDLQSPSRVWMGFRPSMPDSRPVISPSRLGRQVVYAYGHGHIGLTLAPVTATLVAACISGQSPALPIDAYRVDRF